jgi:hypothetical protein
MTLADKVTQFNGDADIARQIIHGDANTTVTTQGGPVRSLAKLISDNQAAIDAQANLVGQLAANNGATKIGNGGETVADSFNALQLADYTALRAYTGPRKSAYVTGYLGTAAPLGIAGMFVRDDSDTTTADNGGTVIVATNGKRWKRRFNGTVMADWFGADPTGVANSSPAWAAAIAYLKAIGGGAVEATPGASYLLNGIAGADGILNGILQPYTSDNGTTGRIHIQGNRCRFLAGSDNMIVLRTSDSHNSGRDFSIYGNGHANVTGHALYPESTTQTTTVVSQSYNRFDNVYINGCTEAVALKCGPYNGALASGCYYNTLSNYKAYSCVRGLWLRSPTNAGGSLVNRNKFENWRVGQTVANTGVQIDAGDTNVFVAVHCELVNYGTTPNATPTAIKILASDPVTGLANNSNRFFGCMQEANARDLDNANSYSEFYGCGMTGSKMLLTANPLVMTGGSDASVIPQINSAYTHQNNGYLSGVDQGVMWLNTPNGLALPATGYAYDQGLKWQNYPLTTSNMTNVTSITEMKSKFMRFGGMVRWHFRVRFQATDATASVVITPPRTLSTHYTSFSSVQPMFIPFVWGGALGQMGTGWARCEANGTITFYAPKVGNTAVNWNAGNASEIHLMLEYMENGF